MNKIIEVNNLKKSYGEVRAVNGISFYVEQGKLFAFLGPNGAGKSTTIDILCTLLKNDSGEVIIDGHRLGSEDNSIRHKIGVVFQDNMLDNLLTVKENLITRGSMYGLSKQAVMAAMEKAAVSTGVEDFLNRPYGKLSGGQRRRADIARALMSTPKILFLDEPTTGLDPQTRSNIWETIRCLQKEAALTVFLTTHYMEEAAAADYVVVIDKGLIAAKGSPTELKQQFSSDIMKLTGNINEIVPILEAQGLTYSITNNLVTVKLSNTVDSIPILERCHENVTNVEVLNGTMDDAFIGITGREIRE